MLPRRVLFACLWAALTVSTAWAEARLEVTGGDDDLRDEIAGASILLRDEGAPDLPADVIAAARAEYGRLLAVLYDQGYFAGVISIRIDGREAAQISPFAAPAAISDIAIRVEPGARFTLGTALVGPLADGDVPADGFAPGAPASTGILREAAQSAIDGWRAAGHATAEIGGQRIIARNRDAEIDAEIEIAPGPVLRFGPLTPSGQDRMPAARLVEIAGLPTGETFDPAEIDRAGNRLRRTGVFSSVALREGAVRPDGTIEIEADVVEAPLRRLGFGAELSSDEGVSLSAFWLHRNLTGGGERLRFDAEINGIGQGNGEPDGLLSVAFSRPATATPDTTFTADARLEYLDQDTFEELVFEFSFGITQQITDDLVGRVGLGLRFSDISDGFGDRQATLLSLITGATWDRRDDTLDPTGGLYADLTLRPFYITDSGEFGGLGRLDLRGYTAFGAEDSTRLAARLQVGTVAGGNITDLPPGFLFFSGGGGTVRGQDFRSLGAEQNGQDTGGRTFIGLSGEVRQDITETIGVVAFYDAGYIAADAIWDDTGEWHSGAGLGVRYATPLGAIRLDVAAPVSGPDADNPIYIYIGIGQAF